MASDAGERRHSVTGMDRATLVVGGVVTLGVVMTLLDTTIINVALDALSHDLHSPIGTIQWVATGYLLSLAIVIPLAGWLSERFGSKRVWMVSVALFGAGSALCGLAPSAGALIFFRILQGLGGGLIMPVSMSMRAQAAGPKHLGRVMSVLGVPQLLGPIMGPVLGGLIVDVTSWRWIFYVNVPIALIALLLGARVLDNGAGRADAGRLDWTGFLLLSPGLAAIVFGLSETQADGGFGALTAFGPLVAGAILVALFVGHALRSPRPLIDVKLFRTPEFSAAAATVLLLGAALFAGMFLLALYFQVGRGQSALDAGLLLAPQGLGAAVAMPFTGRLTDRIGGDRVVWVGCLVMALATVPLAWVTADTPQGLLAALLVVRGLGLGGAMMPSMAAAYASLASSEVPRATSALNALQRVGGSVGTALVAVILERQLSGLLAGGADTSALGQLPAGAREQLAGPIGTAFAHSFAWAAAMIVLALVPAVALALAGRARRGQAAVLSSAQGRSHKTLIREGQIRLPRQRREGDLT
jgi:EmrB/QacA subfamily drug resistance transporter